MASNVAGHGLIEAFSRGDVEAMRGALAADAVFHSPVADYRGLEEITPILRALARIVDVTATVSVHGDGRETIGVFTAQVEGRPADGVLRVVGAPGTPAGEFTLMVRPLETLLAAVKAMGRELESSAEAG